MEEVHLGYQHQNERIYINRGEEDEIVRLLLQDATAPAAAGVTIVQSLSITVSK